MKCHRFCFVKIPVSIQIKNLSVLCKAAYSTFNNKVSSCFIVIALLKNY